MCQVLRYERQTQMNSIYDMLPQPRTPRQTKKEKARKAKLEADLKERANEILAAREADIDEDIEKEAARLWQLETDYTRYTNYGLNHPSIPTFNPEDKTPIRKKRRVAPSRGKKGVTVITKKRGKKAA